MEDIIYPFPCPIYQSFLDESSFLEIQKYLPEIQSKTNPYDVCEKRITEIISTTI